MAHLREAIKRLNEELGVLRNQLEQRDAALEVARRSHEAQVCEGMDCGRVHLPSLGCAPCSALALSHATRVQDATRGRRCLTHAHHPSQVRALEAEIERLRAELEAAKQAEGPSRAALSKLQGQLRAKDDKLRQLRDAFKTLEVGRWSLNSQRG